MVIVKYCTHKLGENSPKHVAVKQKKRAMFFTKNSFMFILISRNDYLETIHYYLTNHERFSEINHGRGFMAN